MTPPPGLLLTGIRMSVGVGAWLAPNTTGKVFGLDAAANPQMAFMARLFGVRDAALAIGAGQASPAGRKLWWQLGVACDVLDAGAAYLAHRDGTVPKLPAALAGGVAVIAAGLGVAALAAEA